MGTSSKGWTKEDDNIIRQQHVCVGHKEPSVFVRLSPDIFFYFVQVSKCKCCLPPAAAAHASIYNPKFK